MLVILRSRSDAGIFRGTCSHARLVPTTLSCTPEGFVPSGALFVLGALMAVTAQGRCQHVRYPGFLQNLPTQSGPRAEKITGWYGRPPLQPKWSTSRLSPGSRAKGTHKASQNTQHCVVLYRIHHNL
jgi:hypothetical protein